MNAVRFFKVKSSSVKDKTYTVRVFPSGEIRCECPGFVFGGQCKHVLEVVEKLSNEGNLGY